MSGHWAGRAVGLWGKAGGFCLQAGFDFVLPHLMCLVKAAWASQVAPVVKNPPSSAGDIRDMGSIPGSGRSIGGGDGNPLQYSYPDSPMDQGAWRATVIESQRVGHD